MTALEARPLERRRFERDDAPPLPADALYGRLLASAAQHLLGTGPAPSARLRLADGRSSTLPLDRWLAPADAVDEAILADVEAPVLDLGCGPGRHLAALRAAGKRGLGVDLSPVAVRLARDRGADAINGSLWSQVPGAGIWRTILLLDGNIGIGGAPVALLRRAGELLAPRRLDRRRDRSAGRAHAPHPRPARGAGRRLGVVPLGARRRRRRRRDRGAGGVRRRRGPLARGPHVRNAQTQLRTKLQCPPPLQARSARASGALPCAVRG